MDRIETDGPLPAHSDVVIIGGGIIGVSTAFFLARQGVSVTLCEKGIIGAEQSGRNWGWCRTMGRAVSEIPLAVESLKLWRTMNEMVEGETGFRNRGHLYVLDGDRDIQSYEAWMAAAKDYQLAARFIDQRKIRELLPGTSKAWASALYTPSDGTAEPFHAVPAIAAGARKLGAIILENCAVRGVETSAGAVSAVVTERGTITCHSAVLCGGAWSRLFAGNMGVELPVLGIINTVGRTSPAEHLPDIAVGGPNFSFRHRLDGGYTVALRNDNLAPLTIDSFKLFFTFLPMALKQRHEYRIRLTRRFIEDWRLPRKWNFDEVTPFETIRTLEPAPVERDLNKGWNNTIAAYPEFASLKVVQKWAGLIDATPDAVPVISAVSRIPGFFLASGFSGHGFGIGPGAGKLMANLVMGDDPIVDPLPFSLSRFTRAA